VDRFSCLLNLELFIGNKSELPLRSFKLYFQGDPSTPLPTKISWSTPVRRPSTPSSPAASRPKWRSSACPGTCLSDW
jgi:hypothetical protein